MLVTGSTNVTEWLTVEWDATLGSDATRLYAAHFSEWMSREQHEPE